MKINTIKIKNIKNVQEFELLLNGGTVLVTAGNNKGKSTILRSLIDRLRGEKPELILKHGEREGYAELELTPIAPTEKGEKFIWEIKEDKEKLTYITSEGIKTTTIKEISKRYFPDVFDIDKFLQDSPKEQIKTLQKLVGIDFSKLDEEYKAAYTDRQMLNRMCAEEKSKVIDFDETYISKEEIKVETILAEIDVLTSKENKRKELYSDIIDVQRRIENYKREIAAAEEYLKKREDEISVIPSNENKIAQLKEQLLNAAEHNQKIYEAKAGSKRAKNYLALENRANEAANKLKQIEASKKELINSANLPAGITIGNEEIKVNGLPLNKNQIGTALLYMTALRLAALQLGKVKTLYFDASTLDKKSLEEILKWAQSQGLQLLIERADYEGGNIKYEIIQE